MPRGGLTATVLMLAGLAVLGAYWWTTRPAPVAPDLPEGASGADAPGPYLTVAVAGEAEGQIVIDLFEQAAPGHSERLAGLAAEGAYDGVVFHRVIDGFMAQTGDVAFGRAGQDLARAGMGGSDRPDLAAEFTDIAFERGVVGMARSADPNSANSQFFIMFAPALHLNGQYTAVGRVTEGLDVLDAIKRGAGPNGAVLGAPDVMVQVTVAD